MLRRTIDLIRFWRAQRITGFNVPDDPHFDPASTPWFVERLGQAKRYLEFGAGGSTLLAARCGVPTTTVESDRFFAKAVQAKLPAGADNRMLAIDIGVTVEWGVPMFTSPTPARIARWRRYVETPFELIAQDGKGFPDLVLVDGRFRRACALATAREAAKAKAKVTLCVDDYAGRAPFHTIESLLGAPVLHGRMAVFELDGAALSIADSAVDDAARDWG